MNGIVEDQKEATEVSQILADVEELRIMIAMLTAELREFRDRLLP